MKRVAVVLVVALLIMLAQASQAADLQAGWYANVGSVYIYSYDGMGQPYIRASGWFVTEPSQYGPFTVSDGSSHSTSYRSVSVSSDISGVESSQSLDLPIAFGMTIGDHIGFVDIGWTTNYDASQMYLQLWETNLNGEIQCVWSQQLSGHRFGNTEILQNTQFEGPFFFRINIVPEPTSALGLLSLLGAGGITIIRRRRT